MCRKSKVGGCDMKIKPKYSQDPKYAPEQTSGGIRYKLKDESLSAGERTSMMSATQNLAGGQPPTPIQQAANQAAVSAKTKSLSELKNNIADVRAQQQQTLRSFEQQGKKPDRKMKQLDKSLSRVEKKIVSIEQDKWANKNYHSDFPETTSVYSMVTDREQMAALCENVAKYTT